MEDCARCGHAKQAHEGGADGEPAFGCWKCRYGCDGYLTKDQRAALAELRDCLGEKAAPRVAVAVLDTLAAFRA